MVVGSCCYLNAKRNDGAVCSSRAPGTTRSRQYTIPQEINLPVISTAEFSVFVDRFHLERSEVLYERNPPRAWRQPPIRRPPSSVSRVFYLWSERRLQHEPPEMALRYLSYSSPQPRSIVCPTQERRPVRSDGVVFAAWPVRLSPRSAKLTK